MEKRDTIGFTERTGVRAAIASMAGDVLRGDVLRTVHRASRGTQ